MCSLFDVDDDAGLERFIEDHGIHHPQRLLFGRRRRPTTNVSIVTARHGHATIENAIWHLYLQREGDRWKPHQKYWSINSNWKKLGQRPEYRKSRCLIPATAWVESQHGKNPVEFSFGDHQPFFFCGLYKSWGETLSCSIITLDAHPDTAQYHEKSFPMIAPDNHDFITRWLGPSEDTLPFEPYLRADKTITGAPLIVQPVTRATVTEYVGARQEV
ncbi:SOS response-associated peptidase family protein [Microbulbifer salipaludis]|uniref:SOS response-associated peptidase family protein n=1 Tax=Microbulbifer salipaludis TaxID=187980 RepID=A0ABS3E7Q6_9GAMM|nr:SOS response-associated peptidase family protein [Microbulbifer salipaludis]MBN8431326.1 SOS response-associated peptidase family protein [Microbulbifer salipaludis]